MNHNPDYKPKVLIAIGGGVAAYKVCEVISQLFQHGAEVRVILTETGEKFITPLTVSTLSRHPVYTDGDFWQPIHKRPLHIELGEWAEVFLIAPLTANTMAKLAHGLADNLLTNTVLASRCPILLAPAMNTDMWEQTSVQRNWTTLLQSERYHSIGPNSGLLACDRQGDGRMAEPAQIIPALQSLLYTHGKKDLINKHILISAGSTQEYLDPVRFIGNPSTGKMGVSLALAAISRGANVTLVHGPMTDDLLSLVNKIPTIPVVSAEEMQLAMKANLPQADWIIMSAAVADVKPAHFSPSKLAKKELPDHLPLAPVPDLVAELSQLKSPQQKIIGFAAQTGDIVKPALQKLTQKGLEAIAANPVDDSNYGFGSEKNKGILIDKKGRQEEIEPCSKLKFAHKLLDFVLKI
jgi:phosphopantothenoylcysteine decarboxylase / phosphopantothenate---cysteine ligase